MRWPETRDSITVATSTTTTTTTAPADISRGAVLSPPAAAYFAVDRPTRDDKDINRKEGPCHYNVYDGYDQDKGRQIEFPSMSQQASAPSDSYTTEHADHDSRDSRDAKLRNEQHNMLSADTGITGTGSTKREREDDMDTKREPGSIREREREYPPSANPSNVNSTANSAANTPKLTSAAPASSIAAAALAVDDRERHSPQTQPSQTQSQAGPSPTLPRPFGVHNILNPSVSDQQSRPLPRTRPGSANSPRNSPRMGGPPSLQNPYGQQQYYGPGSAESSPSLGHAHPASAAYAGPRRILTPKSPRRSSLGRSASGMGGPLGQPPVPPIPASLLPQSMSAPNLGPERERAHLPPHMGSTTKSDTPPRNFSQPFYPGEGSRPGSRSHTPAAESHASLPPLPISREQQQQQQDQGRFPPHHGHPPDHQHHQQQQQHGGYAPGPSPTHAPSRALPPAHWGQGYPGQHHQSQHQQHPHQQHLGEGRTLSMSADGQQFITITPSVGEEIHVPIDIHQASKQADEKRLRNAGASARFRARKKEKDREVQVGIQRLEGMNRELQRRIQDLEGQRDFYRNERNRLRHIIAKTPSLREYAESGPASPASTSFSGGSFAADGSPMIPQQQQQQQQQHSQQRPQQHQPVQMPPHLQGGPGHAQPPLYPPMSTGPAQGPPHAGPPGYPPSTQPESFSSAPSEHERPARRRRTDSGPPPSEYYGAGAGSAPAYTTSAPPPPITAASTLPPPMPSTIAGPPQQQLPGAFHSMSPSPLSASPSNPRLPPLRMDTPGSSMNSMSSMGSMGSLGRGTPTPEPTPGVSSLPAPQPYHPATTGPPATSAPPPQYSRAYETAGWAADAPEHNYPR